MASLPQEPCEKDTDEPMAPTRAVEPLRVSTNGGPAVRDHCDVVVEDALTIMIEGGKSISMMHTPINVMCTPTDVVELAVGFLFSEGIISGFEDIARLAQQKDPNVVAVCVKNPDQIAAARNLIVTSSCGMCGSHKIDRYIHELKPGEDTFRISPAVLVEVSRKMRDRQALFSQTGGTHAAAIFSAQGEISAMGEDIGRHNALDKAVGKCLLRKLSLSSRGVLLSGRISLEMLSKSARAGLELVAAVSAPSSLALDVAQRCNITLCGFVRDDRATVYTHPHRVEGIGEPLD